MTARRILYLNHVGLVAGAERSLAAMVEALDRTRYEPYAICPDGPLGELLAKAGAQVRHCPLQRLRRTRNPAKLLYYAAQVHSVARDIARKWNGPAIDLIHSNSTTAHIYGALLARYWRTPCIWHVRDLVPLGLLGRLLYARADAVIATSTAVADVVRAASGVAEKIRVIPNGIRIDHHDAPGGKSPIRAELGIAESAPVLAVIAQLVPWKRHDVFLKAFAEIAKLRPNAVALIAGDDLFNDNARYKAELLQLTRELRLESNVKFLGWRHDVSAILHACDMVVVPSQAEPFGRVALEAMTAARPVVGTRAGGLPDIVADEETGWLVEPDNPAALSAAMTEALQDPDLARQRGQAGRKRVAERFDITVTTHAVEKLYDDLLKPPFPEVRP